MILRNCPCWEVALNLIYTSCVRWTIVVVHGNFYIVAIFLNAWKCADLIQTAFPCLTEGHAAVQRYGAGVSNCTAAWRSIEDLGCCNSSASKETSLFPVFVVFWIQHFYKTFDLCSVFCIVFVQCTDVLKNVSHFVDCVVSTLRSRTVAGNTFHVYTDFHTSSLSAVDTAVCRLCRYDEFRANLVFVDDVLPAESVAILFLNRSDNHDLASFWNQIKVFHNFCTIYSRNDTAALVRNTTSTDFCLCLISFVWIKVPVFDVSDTYGINVCIVSDDFVTCSHVTNDVTLWVNNNFVKSNFFHLSGDGINMSFLITAFPWIFYDCT